MNEKDVLKHLEMDMQGIVFNDEQKESSITLAHMYVTIYVTAYEDSKNYTIARLAARDTITAMFESGSNG